MYRSQDDPWVCVSEVIQMVFCIDLKLIHRYLYLKSFSGYMHRSKADPWVFDVYLKLIHSVFDVYLS